MLKKEKMKREDHSSIVVTQSLWVDIYILSFDKELCIGCDLCHQVCPKEAISLRAWKGKILPEVDEKKCSLCGLCVTFCPVNAVKLLSRNTWKGTEEEIRPILDQGGIPHFSKGMELNSSLCPPGCDLCVKACPREALTLEKTGLELDRSRCLSCAHCEAACPIEGAIKVTRLFEGSIVVEVEKCEEGCDYCVRVCPTHCYVPLPEKGVKVDSRHCICCGACFVTCPYGAIDLTRMRLRTERDGYSAVWSRAVDRLLSENERFLQQNETSIINLIDILKKSRL
jgi:4Fe-4S ferredoxin